MAVIPFMWKAMQEKRFANSQTFHPRKTFILAHFCFLANIVELRNFLLECKTSVIHETFLPRKFPSIWYIDMSTG